MEGEGCNVRGTPTVIDYGTDVGAGSGLLVRDQHSSIYLLGGLRRLLKFQTAVGNRFLGHRPIRLTQCCTQFKSPGDMILCVLYLHYNVAFTFK